jgi:hypothetical protein
MKTASNKAREVLFANIGTFNTIMFDLKTYPSRITNKPLAAKCWEMRAKVWFAYDIDAITERERDEFRSLIYQIEDDLIALHKVAGRSDHWKGGNLAVATAQRSCRELILKLSDCRIGLLNQTVVTH